MKRLFLVFLLIFSQSVFAYDFEDLMREMAPSDDASKAILSVLQSLESIEFDKNSKSIMDFVWEGMDKDSFYFGDIYRSSYFKPAKNGYRAMTLKHVRIPGSNKIEVVPDCYEDLNVNSCDNYMGIMEFGIKSNAIATLNKYRSFSLSFRSKESWENAGDIQPAQIADGLLKIVDPINIKNLKVKKSCPMHKDLKGETRILMDSFSNTFPNLSGLVDRYLELNNFLALEGADQNEGNMLSQLLTSEGNGNGKVAYTHVELEPKFKTKMLKEDFPEMAKSMEKYRKLITINGVLKNKNGNIYGKLIITPKKTHIECYTHQGKIIPFDENGKLVFEEAGTFESEKEIIADGHVKIDFLGLDLRVAGTAFIENNSTPKKDAISAKLETMNYEYSGRFLGFIPMSVIKFLSPIDLDQFADDMIYVVLRANDGEGSVGSIAWETDDSRNRFSTITVSTEMLDHYMVQFLTRYARIFIGSDNRLAVEQSRTFADKVLSAVITDVKAVYSGMDYDDVGLVQR